MYCDICPLVLTCVHLFIIIIQSQARYSMSYVLPILSFSLSLSLSLSLVSHIFIKISRSCRRKKNCEPRVQFRYSLFARMIQRFFSFAFSSYKFIFTCFYGMDAIISYKKYMSIHITYVLCMFVCVFVKSIDLIRSMIELKII